MSADKRKTLEKRMEEAVQRPLPYEGLTPPNDGISFWPDSERDRRASDANPSSREDFTSLLNAVARKRERED
jgi:hypothetical protein